MYEKLEKYQVKIVPGVGYEVRGQWKDDIHDLKSRMVFDINNFTIAEAAVEASGVPFDICHQGIKSIDALVGASVGKGFSKLVSQHVMGKQGCYHLGELVMNSVKSFLQAASREGPDWLDNEEYQQRWQEWINNYQGVCIYFAQPDISQENIQKAFGK
ncbi:MAG: hypothetical protein CVU90_12185 [Firmicutes bacterium HGW-Firmicutes-15]|nr:MAG: hypothetical protein CVU90_12185 [Firmicutes bacterium HGW-Firmicutes-15]